MQVLVTEASSQVAYHLLYLLASGDVLPHQKLQLILCDREENGRILEGVKYELQDCVFESVSSIKISHNFCEDFKTADLAIILPSPSLGHHGYREVKVSHTFLQERDFKCLEGAAHKCFKRKDSLLVKARGPLSTAYGISNHIKDAYQDSIMTVKLPTPEDTTMPMLSSVQIYGVEGLDLYDELILPKVYPETWNLLQQADPTSDTNISHTNLEKISSEEQLYERLPVSGNSDQVLLVYALEHVADGQECIDKNIERDQTDLWSRL